MQWDGRWWDCEAEILFCASSLRGSSSSWTVSHLEEERIGLRWRRMTDDDDDGDEDLVRSGEYNYSEPVR